MEQSQAVECGKKTQFNCGVESEQMDDGARRSYTKECPSESGLLKGLSSSIGPFDEEQRHAGVSRVEAQLHCGVASGQKKDANCFVGLDELHGERNMVVGCDLVHGSLDNDDN